MRISLNLATRPFADLGPAIKRLRISMAVMAVLSIGFAIGLHFFHSKAEQARARDHSLDGQIGRITRERQQYTDMMHQPLNAELLVQVENLNQLFDEKLFSWTLAMEDLEVVLPGGVQVSSLEPVRAKDGKITLHLRVIGPRDREVKLVENLEHSRRFISPSIVGETAESSEGQNREQVQPVSASNRFNFDIQAEYNPASLGELTATEKTAPAPRHAAREPQLLHAPARPNRALPLPRAGAPPNAAQPGRVASPGPHQPAPLRILPQKPNPGGPQ
jgi:type IV pilus assembly protein PilN